MTRRVSLPDAKYRVLYADPPWSYNDKADAGAVQSGGAERHYPSLSIAETISDMSGLQSPHQARSQTQPDVMNSASEFPGTIHSGLGDASASASLWAGTFENLRHEYSDDTLCDFRVPAEEPSKSSARNHEKVKIR